ncbi:MAG: fimbrillin family protein [Bacteroidales bacterium]
MTREEAEQILQRTFNHSSFYDKQWQTIDKILNGEKILLIEKTGFGKSICFQFPATVIVALLFAGCKKDKPAHQSSNLAIGFKTLEVGTKALPKLTANLQTSGFTVYGYYSNDASPTYPSSYNQLYMGATNVTYSASTWSYSPVKYWPTDGKDLVFYGTDGAITMNSIPEHGTTPATYTAPHAADAGVDLLLAKTTALNTPGTAVPMAFHHALAQVVVSARIPEELKALEFKITKVTLNDIKSEGSVNLLSWEPKAANGSSNEGNGLAWTNSTIINTYELGLAQDTNNETLVDYDSGDYTNIIKTEGPLFIIPQTTTGGAALNAGEGSETEVEAGNTTGTYLEVHYTARDKDTEATIHSTLTAIPVSQKFEPGLKYHFQITLTGVGKYGPTDPTTNPGGIDNLPSPIQFTASVIDWVGVTAIDLTL